MIRKILVFFLLITSANLIAQTNSASPYSFFGIGDEFSPRTIEQNSMGGIGVAFSNYKYLNFTNPAAYANLRYTTYSFGTLHKEITLKNGANTQNANTTGLSYFALAFPIGSKAGFSLGLQPISSVGYSLSNSVTDSTGGITELTVFKGKGGVNRFYATFGMKIFKDVSLGIEAEYSFGNIENSISNQRANVTLSTMHKESSDVRGGGITLGAQYETTIKKDLVLNAGIALKLGNDLNVTGNQYLYSLSFSSTGSEIPRDTISNTLISGSYNLPLKTTFGAGLGKYNKWYIAAEYENQNAYQTNGFLNTTNSAFKYGKSNRFSLGGFILPKINSISSYFDRVTYRAGIRFEKTGLLIDGSGIGGDFSEVNDFGISFGLGLPMKQLSSINLGFEYGKRGTTANNLIQENYFNFRIGLSLTDTNWFQKRKID